VADCAGNQKGRTWRPLEDTAAANHLYASRNEWSRRRRGVDFYDEGALVWLDADTLIREKTNGAKSLDDFCRAFFGGGTGAPEVKPYEFADVFTRSLLSRTECRGVASPGTAALRHHSAFR
jgi:predicted metalloprotease with PDZ domain